MTEEQLAIEQNIRETSTLQIVMMT